jgi:hypothetical protein
VHRAVHHQNCLPKGLPTLAECLQQAGFATVGFNANFRIAAEYGFDRGFDHYFDLSTGIYAGEQDKVPPSDYINECVVSHLENMKAEKVFIAIWAMDTHIPFDPPSDMVSRFLRNKNKEVTGTAEAVLLANTQLDFENLIDLYDAEICRNDQQIGILIEHLKSRGEWDKTTFVLTADHGEMFLEHGHFIAHGGPPYRELTHVPLIIRIPGMPPSRSDRMCGLIDLMPTVLSITGAQPAETAQGRSMLDEDEDEDLPVVCECFRERKGRSLGVFDNDSKLIVTNRRPNQGKGETAQEATAPPPPDFKKLSREVVNNRIPVFTVRKAMALRSLRDRIGMLPARPVNGEWLRWFVACIRHFVSRERIELYDCRDDPGERTNIVVRQPEEAKRLRSILEKTHARNGQLAASLRLKQEHVESDEIMNERLKHLGYID